MAVSSSDQLDLFVIVGADVAARQKSDLMARNWFSLGKNKRTELIQHKFGDDWIKVSGNERYGIATIWDQDVLIFLISQLNAARNEGRSVGRRIQFSGYEFWQFVGRHKSKVVGGKSYNDLEASMARLHHTFVETSIRSGDDRDFHSFNWLNEVRVRKRKGISVGYEVVLCEWLYQAVIDQRLILSIDKSYFTLTGGLERWLYLYCRKSAGTSGWNESFDSILSKSGSTMNKRDFYKALRSVIRHQRMSGYRLAEARTFYKNGKSRGIELDISVEGS
jgi:plasmid replication initiation protein